MIREMGRREWPLTGIAKVEDGYCLGITLGALRLPLEVSGRAKLVGRKRPRGEALWLRNPTPFNTASMKFPLGR
jgi:hypothetical protein